MIPADHLVIAPIIIPLVAGGLMLLFEGRRREIVATINIVATLALLAVSIVLLVGSMGEDPARAVKVYLLGNWPAEFGIVLVADRLAALMLLLTAILGCAALLFALASWHRAGSYFHPLFQFLLMGLNGAFLTGDLFNLFVFFEVLLAASYGLALHGSGRARVRSSLHYIVINLAASSFFLIGVSVIYGTAGTLNMAAVAERVAALDPSERGLFEIGASILGIAFLVKAAAWPLGFWLPPLYAAASPPVAAVFAIMTKVGLYVILRVGSITAEAGGGTSLFFAEGGLFIIGIATISFAAIGMLASQDMGRLAGYSVLVSSGTVLAAIGVGGAGMTSAALFYLVSSTLTVAAFFLLVELVERGRTPADDVLAVTLEVYGADDEEDAEVESEVGIAVPAIMGVLGVAFLACGLLLAGLPPLSGFVAKFAILSNLLDQHWLNVGGSVSIQGWLLLAVILISGLTTVIAVTRAGIRTFWTFTDRELPHVRATELSAVGLLLVLCVGLTIQAGPVMRFMQTTANGLELGRPYIGAVTGKAQTTPEQPEQTQ
ncbi:MAG TPA: monovalent cation/H+ antiporter subunit D [Hyphomicrobiaceae bacterium]